MQLTETQIIRQNRTNASDLYNDYVATARSLLREVESIQMKIASICLKAIDISHGGRGSKNLYTMKKFANDVELNYDTLKEWVSIYNNVASKIDSPIKTKEDFTIAKRVNNNLNIEAKKAGFNVEPKSYKRDLPKEFVTDLFNKYTIEKPFMSEFYTIQRQTKDMLNIISKRDLNIIPREHLINLMETLDKTSDIINNHLSKTKSKR